MPAQQMAPDKGQELRNVTEAALQKLEGLSRQSQGDVVGRMKDLKDRYLESSKISNPAERTAQERALRANFQELRAGAVEEEKDLSQVVFGFNALIEQLDTSFQVLSQPNEDDLSLVRQAEAAHVAAVAALDEAKRARYFSSGGRLEAETKAKEAVDQAAQAIDNAKSEAARRARQRLMGARMEASMQVIQVRTNEAVRIMEDRKGQIAAQVESVSQELSKFLTAKEATAQQLQAAKAAKEAVEAELSAAEQDLSAYENGTPEYVQQEQKIASLRQKAVELEGEVNASLGEHQAQEKFIAEFQVHISSQQKLLNNQVMWIRLMKVSTEARIKTFLSRLSAMQSASDQEIAKTITDVGHEVDQRNAQYMADIGHASDQIMMEQLEKHPERMAELNLIARKQAEAHREIRTRFSGVYQEFMERWGIDPLTTSFLGAKQTETRPAT